MPVVPRLPDNVSSAALPNVRVSPDAPAAAFGAGPGFDAQTKAANGIFNAVDAFARQAREQADKSAVLEASNKLSELSTKLEYDPEIGFKNKRGKNALDGQSEANHGWESGVSQIQEGLANGYQRKLFQEYVGSKYQEFNKSLQSHVSSEMDKYESEQLSSFVTNERNSAAESYQDHARVIDSIGRQAKEISDYADRKGYPPEWAEAQTREAISKTHTDVIGRYLANGKGIDAQKYFNTFSDQIGAKEKSDLQTKMQHEVVLDIGAKKWVEMQDYRLADGNPDEAKMQSEINNDKSLTQDQKLKVWEYVKARAGEDATNKKKEEAASERNFFNTIISDKSNGGSLESAIRTANLTGRDEYDRAIRVEAAKKLYAPPSESDPSTWVNIKERLINGTATRDEIDNALTSQKINVNDFKNFRVEYYKNKIEGTGAKEKNAWEAVKILSQEHFGNQLEREKFIHQVHSTAEGKSPEEIVKSANDYLKTVPGTGWKWMLGLGGDAYPKKVYEIGFEQNTANTLAVGKMHEDIGENVVNAISSASQRFGKSFGPQDVDAFAATFGGYSAIKKGTKVNNAMQSLVRHGQLVTPANVNDVLNKYPDGNF